MAAIGSNGAGRNGHSHGGYDPKLLELAWRQLEQEWPTIEKMCQIAVRRGNEHWHEALSEVALRLPDTLLSWDPAGGRTLSSHVIGNCRWYLFKEFVYKRRQRESREQAEAERRAAEGRAWEEPDDHSEQEDSEVVQYVLDGIHPYHRAILQLYYLSGLTYQEMGDRLGCSKQTIGTRVRDALEAAQERLAEMR